MLSATDVAVALQDEVVASPLDDAMQHIVPRYDLRQHSIAHVVGIVFLEEDAVAHVFDEGAHAVAFDVDGIGFTFAEHLRHFAQPGIVGQFVPVLKSCRVQRLPLWALLGIGLVMGIGSYFIRQVSPQDHWIWPFGVIPMAIEPAHYLQYVMMFVLGVLAGRCGWLERTDNRTGAATLAIGILLAIGNYVRGDGAWNGFVWRWFGIYESLMCVFISFGLLWLFREYANWSGRFWRWSAEQSYGAYVFHMLLMLVLQNLTDGIWMGAFGKFLFIGVVSTVISFGFTWLVRLIPGVKKVL